MGLFRRKVPSHFIPIHRDNTANKDWVIVLEASTIVGPSPVKLRVAKATQEHAVVKRYNILLQSKQYLVVDGYNPRIHAVYFCPQLYRQDRDGKLAPLQGEEIGTLIAQSIEPAVASRTPWYEPSARIPQDRLVGTPTRTEFDTVVVEMPVARGFAAG